ncbi:hypothetical protein BGW41_004255 [Actinomortierella wolfii]|nr:hypothetical protein BGW41_004255 [Actinomortierella wolfii]
MIGVGENGHQGENQEMFIQSSAILESTQLDPDDVERLWQYYTRLVWSGDSLTNQGVANIQQTTEEAYRPPSLTLLEYEQLMDLIGHTTSRVGGGMREKRVLQLYDDAKRTGLVPSTQMYAWVVNAAFEALAAPTTIRAIYSDFVRSHHHRRSAAISEKASKDTWKRDQERLLKVIVNGFATKGMILQGIEFLDTAVHYEDPDLVQSLYARLVQSHFAQEEHYTGVLRHKHADRDRIVEFFRRKASLSYDRIRRLMTRLENSDDGAILLKELSSHGLGSLLIQMREQQSLGALLVSLLRQSHMDEAIRLLDAMVDKDIMPPLTTIRTRLVRSMPKNGNQAQRARMEQILHAWDDATGSRGLFVLDAIKTVSDGREIDLEHDPLTPASRAREWTQQPQLRWELPGRSTQDYEAMIESLIRKQELGTAVDVAKYFASRGWKSQNLDFLKLNSFMINFSTSDRFIQYFHVRFLLGPAARPDLHTFRRFIYASCRRSDLYTALSLFQILRTTRPEGKLDATLYNPIISAASSIPGRMPVAEKMFQAMRQSGVKPDLYTYHAMLNGYANAGNLEAAKRIPPLMLQHGLEPTTKTFNLVIKAYLRARNDISTCRRLLKIMEKSPMDVGPDQVTINMLLESYHKTGNDFWLDHFLENYVTEAGRQATTDPSSESMSSADVQKSKSRQSCNQLEQAPSDQQQQQKPSELAYRHLIAMSKQGDSHPDYWTMHSVLKLALWETNISVDKVWSLWKAMKVHILAPSDQPITYVPFTKVLSSSDRKSTAAHSGPVTSNTSGSAATTTTTNTAPKTVTRTMSNDDYFKWTTLQLFWHAFKQQGDVRGIKMVNRVALDLFPDKTLQFSSSSSSSADSQSSGGTTSSIDQTLSTSLFAKTWKEFSQHMAAHSVTAKQAAVERRAASQEALQKLVADQQALKVAEAHRERRHQVATRERFGSSWALSKQQQQQQQQQQLHPSSQPSHKDEDTSHNEGDNQ